MDYVKKVLVLKQITDGYALTGKTISGIARVETESNVSTLHLSLINVALVEGGSFYLFFIDGLNKVFSFDLGAKPTNFSVSLPELPDIDNGFSLGLCLVKDDIPLLICFASCDKKGKNVTEFRKCVVDKCLVERKISLSKKDDALPPLSKRKEGSSISLSKQKESTSIPFPKQYDDEVVATENYYVNDQDISRKLKLIEGLEINNVRDENELSTSRSQKEEKKADTDFNCFEDETIFDSGEVYNQKSPFYLTVKQELDDLFEKFPVEEDLERAVANSKWVKIFYSNTQYYVVGLVYCENVEKYVCYGVPAKYSLTPPKELDGFCSFVPLSVFDMKGDGYWMMFQDAITGECIRLADNK